MHPKRTNAMNKKFLIASQIIAAFGTVVLVAHATPWADPTSGPPAQSLQAPLTPTNIGQIKFGGLTLNAGALDAVGLAILGGDSKGFVGIGTANPTEKLDIVGNLLLSGYLGFSGGSGQSDQIVGVTPDGKTNWTDRYTWLTLVGQPGTGGPYCGNGSCSTSGGETCSTCPSDCGTCGGPPPPPPPPASSFLRERSLQPRRNLRYLPVRLWYLWWSGRRRLCPSNLRKSYPGGRRGV